MYKNKPRVGSLFYRNSGGFTIVELMVATVILSILATSTLGLFSALIGSATTAKHKAVAQSLATNQMEFYKSLPYDSLAIAGGSNFVAPTYLPRTSTQTINKIKYTVTSNINVVDDAYDGCGPAGPTECRNYPPPASVTTQDQNAADYKIIHVKVTDPKNLKLAEVDTQVSARVAETDSNTGSLTVKVVDSNGSAVGGATVRVRDTTVTPNVDLTDSTSAGGIAIFYLLTPDTNAYDYNITASLAGYSTLTTIIPSGTLIPTASNQKIFAQQASTVTMTLMPQGPNSLVIETTDTSGSPIDGVKVYVKGGYKKYTSGTDTSYCYDNMTTTGITNSDCSTKTAADIRPTTGSDGFPGLAGISDLVPGPYIFCGDKGDTNCKAGATTYYVAAALPYSGLNPFNPVNVPTYSASSPPSTVFNYNGKDYYQKVRLMLTTNSSFPRVFKLSPDDISQGASNFNAFAFQITGLNLPCSTNPASCSTSVKISQGATTTYTASCTGSSAGTTLNCTVNLTGASVGLTQLKITVGANTLTIPANPALLGGINVGP